MNCSNPLVDSFGRRINYLRISLTDRCNFRCVYCMPSYGLPLVPKSEHLTRQEIVRFVKIAAGLGVDRIRLTGGEPTLRNDVLDIIHDIKLIEGVRDLSLTTNGSRLSPIVKSLKVAGLDRINISLDSLGSEGFKAITMTDCYKKVVEAIGLALMEGFRVKLNVVILNNLNNHEIIDFVNLAYQYPLEVRFLEFMPLCGSGWRPDLFVPITKVRKIVMENFVLIRNIQPGSVASVFGIEGGRGKVGFIASLTESFCSECSRIRLTCDGKIRPCLFSNQEISVRYILKNSDSEEKLIEAIQLAVRIKPQGNSFYEKPFQRESVLTKSVSMPYIRSIGG